MSLLSSTLITRKKVSVLNEAEDSKYGLSDAIIAGISDSPTDEPENVEEETPAAESPVDDMSADAPAEGTEDSDNADPTATGDEPPMEDDPTSPADETEGMEDNTDEFTDEEMAGDGSMTEDEMLADTQKTPGLRILTSISDNQYKLCNATLHQKFTKLASEITDIINNTIMVIRPNNDREAQVVGIVHDNLSKMVTDIHNYSLYTFSDTYESNVVAYISFLKRYKIAMQIIDELIKARNTEDPKEDK